jgi:hypothetical protein
MRKFKFRIWHKKENRWLDIWAEEDPILSLKDCGHGCEVFIYNRERKSHDNLNCLMTDVVIQQYIGLKDKSGKEIYEGDIITFDNSEIGGQKYEGIVEWNDDQCLDNLCWGLWIKNRGWLHCDFLGTIEVIGNIFENPELLK